MCDVAADRIEQKWREYAESVEALAARVGNPDDFPVVPRSSLAGDDAKSHPFEVSHALRHLINASVDQLHGVKVVVRDANYQHLAVSNTLVRAALENTATGLWILGPGTRPERIERALRWHARNYHDFASYVRSSDYSATDMLKRNAASLDQIADIADRLGIDPKSAKSGFQVTEPIKGARCTPACRCSAIGKSRRGSPMGDRGHITGSYAASRSPEARTATPSIE